MLVFNLDIGHSLFDILRFASSCPRAMRVRLSSRSRARSSRMPPKTLPRARECGKGQGFYWYRFLSFLRLCGETVVFHTIYIALT
jgi:hypothetical protein